MKVVILAGGYGTRISEESRFRPKPMIAIGEYPILWHIMKIFSSYGYNDFIICAGYKSSIIKDYFLNYYLYQSDVTIDLSKFNKINIHKNNSESWRVTIVETGLDTMTGGRIRRICKYVEGNPFMLTYGDGLADIDLHKLVQYHQAHGKLATVTAVKPKGRFGALSLDNDGKVEAFQEKITGDSAWVNGGFFVLQPDVFDYINGDETVFEREPLESLAAEGELMAFRHAGFWYPMDTMKDHRYLEELCKEGKPPWLVRGKQQ
jgi:glucose-1-phosphate cytidylyltransferase